MSGPRITTGGESSSEEFAQKIVAAVASQPALLLPGGTSRTARWLSQLAPGLYANIMKRRVGAEFRRLP